MKFDLGERILITPDALIAVNSARKTPREFVLRHADGDWGCVCPEDAMLNDRAVEDGSRLLSSYVLPTGVKVWIITEAADDSGQRVATTILLPEEY